MRELTLSQYSELAVVSRRAILAQFEQILTVGSLEELEEVALLLRESLLHAAVGASRVCLVLVRAIEALLSLQVQLVQYTLGVERLVPKGHEHGQLFNAVHLVTIQRLALLTLVFICRIEVVKISNQK